MCASCALLGHVTLGLLCVVLALWERQGYDVRLLVPMTRERKGGRQHGPHPPLHVRVTMVTWGPEVGVHLLHVGRPSAEQGSLSSD